MRIEKTDPMTKCLWDACNNTAKVYADVEAKQKADDKALQAEENRDNSN